MPKNNKVALIVMIAVMIMSSSISAVGAMNKMSKDINDHFFTGDEFNLSIHGDLDKKTVIATNVANLARYYISEKDDHLKAITDTVQAMTRETSVSKLFKLNSTLDDNVNYVINQLNGLALSDTHKKMLTGYAADYKSKSTTIANDNYNTLVKGYYDEISGFPGIIFRIFAKNPEYFK